MIKFVKFTSEKNSIQYSWLWGFGVLGFRGQSSKVVIVWSPKNSKTHKKNLPKSTQNSIIQKSKDSKTTNFFFKNPKSSLYSTLTLR